MPLYLGVDDTDSLRGMCTTFLATELLRALPGVDLIGLPRLVRLNPNIPWKTRGNGAICLRLGRGRGRAFQVGELDGHSVLAYARGDSLPPSPGIAEAVARVVAAWSELDDPTTNPAFVLLRRPPPPGLYWRAVREVVAKPDVVRAIRGLGLRREWKNGRGVIGAAAATAWRPRDRTYEVLAYRHPSRWGTRREVPPDSVRRLDVAFPSTFNNYDPDDRRVVIAPRTPCPVLCGIRGDDPSELPPALRSLGGEPPDRWLLFETNQGTDDHVLRDPRIAKPWTTLEIAGTVVAEPRTIPGGHVVVPLQWRETIDIVAYEPSKRFRRVVRALSPGDLVRVVGAVRETPRSLNIEKLEVLGLAPTFTKGTNPQCPVCGKRMKSSGRSGPFRCRGCGTRRPRSDAVLLPGERALAPGWYEPPVGSRRHLSMPLKRMAHRMRKRKGVVGRTPNRASPSFSRGADSLPTTAFAKA
jgi:tRNA(Ile2)-agmatinylcytidine synthase